MAPTCVVLPVPQAARVVDLARAQHPSTRRAAGRLFRRDPARGMPPHLTLLYPFVEDAELGLPAIREVQAVVGRFPAFQFAFTDVRRFDNLPDESYAWLAPTPAQPFIELTEALRATFPEHQPYGGRFPTIVPHLTVAASADAELLERVEQRVTSELPLAAKATTVSVMGRARGAWRLRASAALGGG